MIDRALSALGQGVLEATLLGAALTVALWLVLHLSRRRLPPGWRAALWWLIAARVVLELAGVPALEWEVLPAERPSTESIGPLVAIGASDGPPAASVPTEGAQAEATSRRLSSPGPRSVLAGVWLVGVLSALGVAVGRSAKLAAVVRRAAPVDDPERRSALARARALVGIRREVELVISPAVDSPFVYGLFSPTVVLPARATLAGEELVLVLAHELAHVRRGDVWLALLPALARRLFFFHPLIRLAEREYALAVEAACDRLVVSRRSATADRYARLLVALAAGNRMGPATAGAWPFAASSTRRRLEMLLDPRIDRRRLTLALPFAALLALGIAVPVRLAVAEPSEPPVPPSIERPEAQPAAPLAPSAGERWPTPPERPRVAPFALAAGLPPRAPVPPAAPVAPLPSIPRLVAEELAGADWLVFRDGDSSLVFSAGSEERRWAERLAAENGGSILLLGRDGEVLVGSERQAIDAMRQVLDRFQVDSKAQRDRARELAEAARREAQTHRELLRERSEALREAAMRAAELAERTTELRDHRRLERLTEVEAERMAQLARRLDELSPLASEEGGERLRAVSEHLESLEHELAVVGEELARMREELRVGRFEAHQRMRDAATAELEELRRQLDRLRDRQDAERWELEHEMENRARDRRFDLERTLDELIEQGHLEPVDEER